MAKVKVTCECLNVGGVLYQKDAIVELSDDDALVITEKDGTGVIVGDDAEVTEGIPNAVDAIERHIQNKEFEEARMQSGMTAPPASQDPKAPVAPVILPANDVKPLGQF